MAKVAIKNYMEKTDYFGWILKSTLESIRPDMDELELIRLLPYNYKK